MKFYQLFCNGKTNPLGIDHHIRFNWNYKNDGKRCEKQCAFQITVWNVNNHIVLDSGKINSSDMGYTIPENSIIEFGTPYFWQITAWTDTEKIQSEVQTFETAIDSLENAAWIECGLKEGEEPSAPIFCKCFAVAKEILRARVYITGLGLFKCQANGYDCTDSLLTPPCTPYDEQTYFETLDITPYLKNGNNEFTVQLGNGYNKDFSQWGYRYFTPKGLRAVIVLSYCDGTSERIETDESWLWQDSPIIANGLYLGEEYDARRKFDISFPAVISPEHAPAGHLIPNEMPPLRIIEAVTPVAQWEIDGGMMYDFGKNSQGFCRIEINAPEGCTVSLQHSEMITPEGASDVFTNRNARAKDIYICSGNGTETYQPTFTYHGFRYVFVTCSMAVSSFNITACFLSADVGEKADFSCSEPIINRIHTLCTNSIRSNLVSIPTDCPVRDERTPCLMDSQMYEDAAMYNFNMYAYYMKWLRDITITTEDYFDGNMDWNGDRLMLAYRMYLFYGESDFARKFYPIFKKMVEMWFEKSDRGIWLEGFGDWCLPNNNTWEGFFGCKEILNTSLLHAYTGIMAEFAELFGFVDDKKRFLSIGKSIRDAFVERFWHKDGTVGDGRQSAMFISLFYGVLTGEQAEKTKKALIEKIKKDCFFDVGGFGIRTVLPVLADTQALNLFLETIRLNHYPGFGYWVAMGATSLWEQWASKGNMHSHNHALHAGIDAALFQTICGIVPTSPMFRTFRIAPQIPEDMRDLHCRLETYSGNISLSLEKLGDTLVLSCVIPPNTEAELTFPELASYDDCLLFDGERVIEKSKTLKLGSGSYNFRLIPESYISFEPYQQ